MSVEDAAAFLERMSLAMDDDTCEGMVRARDGVVATLARSGARDRITRLRAERDEARVERDAYRKTLAIALAGQAAAALEVVDDWTASAGDGSLSVARAELDQFRAELRSAIRGEGA